MNDIQVITQFRRLISDFKGNQKSFEIAIMNGDFKDPVVITAFINMYKLVIEIKEKLAQYDVLQIDDLILRNDLIAIRENKGFFLEIVSGEKAVFQPEISMDKWWNILQEEIIPHVDPDTLIRRQIEVGALLVGKTIPKHLRGHLAMIKECYTWGFADAASIYCRTILEEGFREALKSKSEFRTPQGKKELENQPLAWLLNRSQQNRYFYKEPINRAFTINDNVKKIVHPTSAKEARTTLSNLEIIKETFYVMEMLFR